MDTLARILAPFDAEIVLASLRGERTVFDVDGTWHPHHHGAPRQAEGEEPAFDGKAFLAAAQAVAWLYASRPVGDEQRAQVPAFYAKVRARLASPTLILMSHFGDGAHPYVYFRPAELREGDGERLAAHVKPIWKSETFPFASYYGVHRTFVSPSFERLVDRIATSPLAPGAFEADPRASAPEVVREVASRHRLSEDAATYYVQLLALADCTDDDIATIDGWSEARIRAAGRELVERSLVVADRRLRAGRGFALPGAWEKLRAPQPGIEREKLALYDASIDGDMLAAPFGRILPIAPFHEVFATAWANATALEERKPRPRPKAKSATDGATEAALLADILANADDDAPRLVYADLLLERGDRRGELIALGCELARSQIIDDAARHRYETLLEDTETTGTALLEQHAAKIVWDRGFVSAVHMKIPSFIKIAAKVTKEHPLLRRLVVEMGLRRITDKQLDDLAACPELAHLHELDFSDHFVHARAFVRFLDSPRLALRVLRIGANTRGGGIGKIGSKAIASSPRLSELRILDIPAQRIGDAGAQILAAATNMPKLEELRVPSNDLTDVGALALLDAPSLKGLRVLELESRPSTPAYATRENRFGDDVRRRIANDPRSAGDWPGARALL